MTTQRTGGRGLNTLKTFSTDLSRVTTSGYGTLYGAVAARLHPGEHIAVTDEEADTLEAEVLRVTNESAEIRVFWDKVLHRV